MWPVPGGMTCFDAYSLEGPTSLLILRGEGSFYLAGGRIVAVIRQARRWLEPNNFIVSIKIATAPITQVRPISVLLGLGLLVGRLSLIDMAPRTRLGEPDAPYWACAVLPKLAHRQAESV